MDILQIPLDFAMPLNWAHLFFTGKLCYALAIGLTYFSLVIFMPTQVKWQNSRRKPRMEKLELCLGRFLNFPRETTVSNYWNNTSSMTNLIIHTIWIGTKVYLEINKCQSIHKFWSTTKKKSQMRANRESYSLFT